MLPCAEAGAPALRRTCTPSEATNRSAPAEAIKNYTMSELRLNAYRIMWLFVFFDLPTNTKAERRHATQFRKALEKDGFTMMQFSVYVRHCPSKENLEVHLRRVRRSMPPAGFTTLLSVTDRQYAEIRNFWGKTERSRPETPQQLEFF